MTLSKRKVIYFLTDTAEFPDGFFPEAIKILVAGLTLTESHILNVGNKEFYLVVTAFVYLVKPSLGSMVIHLGNSHKSQVIASLRISGRIVFGKSQSLLCQYFSRIKVTIVKRIRKIIQLIYFALMRWRTS